MCIQVQYRRLPALSRSFSYFSCYPGAVVQPGGRMHFSPCSKLSNSRSSSPNCRQLSHCRNHVLDPKIRLKRAFQSTVSPRAGQEAQAGDSGLDLLDSRTGCPRSGSRGKIFRALFWPAFLRQWVSLLGHSSPIPDKCTFQHLHELLLCQP